MTQMLDVAISLALIFLLFSMLVSALQEILASALNWRGRGWEEAMQRWLDGSFSRTSLIGQSFRLSRRKDLPQSSLAKKVLSHGALTSLMKSDRLPSYAPAEAVSNALIDALRERARDETPTVEGLRWAIAALENNALREQLEPILQQSGDDLAVIRAKVAATYSDVMDRVSGQYKRFSQVVLFVLGLLVAIVFNVDTIYLTTALWENEALRAPLVATAQTMAEEGAQPSADDRMEAVADQLKKIEALKLPIGWSQARFEVLPETTSADWHQSVGQWFWRWIWPVLGWVITAVALSQGAPFWFDLMSTLVRVRGAGKKPEAQNETKANGTAATAAPGQEVGGGVATVPEAPATEFERTSLSKDDVLRLQDTLNVMATGVLDAATRQSLRNFQRNAGMTADGKVTLEVVRELWPPAFGESEPAVRT